VPIINVVPTTKKIIFSPAGVLNKLAIEQLYNGKRRVCESYDLVRVTSTREICRKSPQYKYSTAVLYGGLKYDEDIDTMIAESKSVRGDMISASERFRGYTSSATRKGWDYLPGTLSEINEVSSIFSKGNVRHSLYSAEKGNEESFKALSGDRFDILHIATHGFYMSEPEASRSDFFARNPFMDNNLNVNTSSLYRSGLMMSGGNKAWVGETLPDGIEDGILSAAEICNLDFNSCDIVVLSACDTGLGEITDEGVFGLQRSFKIAGVNTIIMSLWEVDDQATSYMMQNFYKNLVKGKSKREAFSIAQAEVKKKYTDPRYWAAFIMLD
jgi:CHAT domain-containing protein